MRRTTRTTINEARSEVVEERVLSEVNRGASSVTKLMKTTVIRKITDLLLTTIHHHDDIMIYIIKPC